VKVARHHGSVHRAFELRPRTVLKVIEDVDGLRRPELLEDFLLACEADARGRTGLELDPYPQAALFAAAARAAREVTAGELLAEGLRGKALGDELHARRVHAIAARLRNGD
jgi:tRNA nucleotidyltransferase (CCA-adding enzyme)